MIAEDKITTKQTINFRPGCTMALSRATLAALFSGNRHLIAFNQSTKQEIHCLYSKHEAIILSSNAVIPPKTEICLLQEIWVRYLFVLK
jgi:hypothetical protein